MKWYLLFIMRGLSVGGPYDSEQACHAALADAMAQPIVDPGFDHAKAFGVCFQGSQPKLKE